MKLGIVVYSPDAEAVWNAFRLGMFALGQGDEVRAFLLAKGVDSQALGDEKFNVTEQMQAFADKGGNILARGTCLKLRHREGSELCPLSTMKDLYELVRDCDKVISI